MKKGSSRHPPNEMQLSCSVSPIPDCKDTTIPFTCKHEKGTFRQNPLFLRRNPYFYRQNRVSFSLYTYIYICIGVAAVKNKYQCFEGGCDGEATADPLQPTENNQFKILISSHLRCIFCNYREIRPLNPEI